MKYILASFFVFLLIEQAALGEDCPAVKISLPKLIKTYSKRAN
jgi:hypothetical protein